MLKTILLYVRYSLKGWRSSFFQNWHVGIGLSILLFLLTYFFYSLVLLPFAEKVGGMTRQLDGSAFPHASGYLFSFINMVVMLIVINPIALQLVHTIHNSHVLRSIVFRIRDHWTIAWILQLIGAAMMMTVYFALLYPITIRPFLCGFMHENPLRCAIFLALLVLTGLLGITCLFNMKARLSKMRSGHWHAVVIQSVPYLLLAMLLWSAPVMKRSLQKGDYRSGVSGLLVKALKVIDVNLNPVLLVLLMAAIGAAWFFAVKVMSSEIKEMV